jgi:hypothetical protein
MKRRLEVPEILHIQLDRLGEGGDISMDRKPRLHLDAAIGDSPHDVWI